MGLEQFEARLRTHFAADDAAKIVFDGHFVDDNELLFVHDDAQGAAKGLGLLTLPMEPVADGDVFEGEGCFGADGGEDEFAVEITSPEDAAVAVRVLLRLWLRMNR